MSLSIGERWPISLRKCCKKDGVRGRGHGDALGLTVLQALTHLGNSSLFKTHPASAKKLQYTGWCLRCVTHQGGRWPCPQSQRQSWALMENRVQLCSPPGSATSWSPGHIICPSVPGQQPFPWAERDAGCPRPGRQKAGDSTKPAWDLLRQRMPVTRTGRWWSSLEQAAGRKAGPADIIGPMQIPTDGACKPGITQMESRSLFALLLCLGGPTCCTRSQGQQAPSLPPLPSLL